MKILSAKFVGFQGFYTGMGKKVLEIDFSKAHTDPIFMLFGKNRSGKTTLISALHPFPGSNDARGSIICEKEDGEKEIVYLVDGKKIKIDIKYIWKEADETHEKKCYIYEEVDGKWKNLNASGKIRSYQDTVKDILGVTEDYFIVGRIGGVANFVDLNKSDRKRFIGQFLPAVDPYLNFYKKVSESYTMLRRQMNTFKDELLKLTSKEECETFITSLTDDITKLDEDIAKENGNYGAAKGIIDHILADTDANLPELRIFARTGVNEIEKKINELKVIYETMKNGIPEDFVYANVDKDIEALQPELDSAKESKTSSSTMLNTKKSERNEAQDKLDQANAKLESLAQSRKSVENLNAKIAKLEKDLEESLNILKDNYSDIKFKKFSSYGQAEIAILKRDVRSANIAINSIREDLARYNCQDTDFTSLNEITKYAFEVKKELMELEKKHTRLVTASNDIKYLEQQAKLEEVIEKRPAGCKIDSCPFIAAAVGSKGSKSRLTIIQKEVAEITSSTTQSQLEERIKFLNDKITYLSSSEQVFNKFKKDLSEMLSLRLVSKIQQLTDPENYLKLIHSSEAEVAAMFDISEIESYVTAKLEMEAIRNNLANTKLELKAISNEAGAYEAAAEAVEEAEGRLEKINEVLTQEQEKFDASVGKVEEIEAKITSKKNLKKAYEVLMNKESEIKALEEKNTNMLKYLDQVEENRTKLLDADKVIKSLKSTKESKEKLLESYKYQKQKRTDIEKSIAEVEENFTNTDYVKQACDQTKGIPLYLMDTYLSEIRETANRLLSIAFNGEFTLGKFKIDEKEFSIPVIMGNGSELADCTLGSGAERSFITQALSLAILAKTINGKYNIVYLDEVDGPLDEHNRTGFVKMLRRQLTDLGVEQCFVISHNREFLQEPCNMILLKDHGIETTNQSIMSNKTVLFEYKK